MSQDKGTAYIQVNSRVACDKVLKQMEYAIQIYVKQDILYAKLKNDNTVEEKDKDIWNLPWMVWTKPFPPKVVFSLITQTQTLNFAYGTNNKSIAQTWFFGGMFFCAAHVVQEVPNWMVTSNANGPCAIKSSICTMTKILVVQGI